MRCFCFLFYFDLFWLPVVYGRIQIGKFGYYNSVFMDKKIVVFFLLFFYYMQFHGTNTIKIRKKNESMCL